MCRIVAHVGPPLALSQLLFEPPHSLERQSYRPREMLSGTVNVDGTGVAWWRAGERLPMRYVTERPPWADPNLPGLAPRLTGSPILAAVRSATPGIAGGPGAVLPFVHGPLAGAHNGYLGAFRESVGPTLLRTLPADLLGALDAVTDSAVLFLLAVDAWRRVADPGLAAVEAVRRTAAVCREAGVVASLNLVLADADGVVAVRAALGVDANSLYVREQNAARTLASEPLDDDEWRAVPVNHLVRLRPEGIAIQPLDEPAVSAR